MTKIRTLLLSLIAAFALSVGGAAMAQAKGHHHHHMAPPAPACPTGMIGETFCGP